MVWLKTPAFIVVNEEVNGELQGGKVFYGQKKYMRKKNAFLKEKTGREIANYARH